METKPNLCLDCGLCCDGSLFTKVKVTPHEQSDLLNVLTIVPVKSGNYFHLPCPEHSKGCCQIYHKRPQTCKDYVCHTLRDFNELKVSHMQAIERINTVKQKKDWLVNYLIPLVGWDAHASLLTNTYKFEQQGVKDMGAQEFRRVHGNFLLELYLYKRYLKKNFGVGYKSESKKSSNQ